MKLSELDKWDQRFLNLAEHIAGWSLDPSTKVGAVLVRPNKSVASVGFNGFPQDIEDNFRIYDREIKLAITVHAEMNALAFCADTNLAGYTLYTWPMLPCSRCMSMFVQKKIKCVVAPLNTNGRWADSIHITKCMCSEARIEYLEVDCD